MPNALEVRDLDDERLERLDPVTSIPFFGVHLAALIAIQPGEFGAHIPRRQIRDDAVADTGPGVVDRLRQFTRPRVPRVPYSEPVMTTSQENNWPSAGPGTTLWWSRWRQ